MISLSVSIVISPAYTKIKSSIPRFKNLDVESRLILIRVQLIHHQNFLSLSSNHNHDHNKSPTSPTPMAQGAIKKTSGGLSQKSKRPTALAPKRGTRVIAPKKSKLIAKKKLTKKHSAGLTALTEKNLAQKAGHLEMLVGGKRGKKAKEREDREKERVKAAAK